MKITTMMRVLLAVMSLVMMITLFACGDGKAEDTNVATDAATEADTQDDTKAETETKVETDSKEEDTTAPDGAECKHVEEKIPGKKYTCTETGLTDGIKCAKCGEILKEQEEIPSYHNLQY